MNKLKAILIEKGISQEELHRLIIDKCKTPIGKDRISMIVNGKVNNYSVFTLLKICMALNVTPNDIVDKETFLKEECY